MACSSVHPLPYVYVDSPSKISTNCVWVLKPIIQLYYSNSLAISSQAGASIWNRIIIAAANKLTDQHDDDDNVLFPRKLLQQINFKFRIDIPPDPLQFASPHFGRRPQCCRSRTEAVQIGFAEEERSLAVAQYW